MLTLTHQDIAIGKKRIQFSCTLKEMSDKETYEVGDRLQGELKIIPYGHVIIERVQAKLEFIVQSQSASTEIPTGEIIISNKVKLSSLKPSVFPIDFPEYFNRANQLSLYPKTFWRLTFTFTTPASIKSGAMGNKPSANTFTGSFKIPVALGKGNYFATPRELPVKRFSSAEKNSLFLLSSMMLASLLFLSGDFSKFISFLLVAISLPLIILRLIKLSGFRNAPMQLVRNKNQKLIFRTLDRGKKNLSKVTVGYRVVTENYNIQPKNRKHARHTFYIKELLLADNAKRTERFLDLTLPWPEKKLPTSFRSGQHGYAWEFFIKTPGIFGKKEHAWPVEVDWEAFRLPGKNVNEPISEDVLELEPLKERVRLKNEKDG